MLFLLNIIAKNPFPLIFAIALVSATVIWLDMTTSIFEKKLQLQKKRKEKSTVMLLEQAA